MSTSKPQESGKVRIEPSLNKSEEEFVAGRKKSVLQSLKKLQINCSQDEVPNIALLGSGGGQRAMVGLLGSLVQLQKTDLLDCILYLSGISGSTWCMASLYQESDWSIKLETVKEKIIQRLSGPRVSSEDAFAKLKKYYYGKDHFSLTDVWAAMLITEYVKEIDENTLTEQWDQHRKDPFPIYTAIDKLSKQRQEGDPWFEITPHEAGYSLTGAFVDTSDFGSQFDNGHKKKQQDEFDMLYLQALCGSALADEVELKKLLWQKIKDFFQQKETVLEEMKKEQHERSREALERERGKESVEELVAGIHLGRPEPFLLPTSESRQLDPNDPAIDECYQVLMNLVDMNLSVLTGKDPSDVDESTRTTLNDLSGGSCHLRHWIRVWPLDALASIIKCTNMWIWGRNYNFLHNMTDEAVPAALLESETRDHIDAGLLLNSPYFSVLRKERNVDLIISLDFSAGDPFMTVRDTANICKKLNIPFPEINVPSEDIKKPKDFYVFKGKKAPTVIHIPLFNVVNCGGDIEAWKNKFKTFQLSYSAEMIADLMKVAGKNIINNKAKLVEQIRAVTEQKRSRR